ncbi:hypothetical protein ABEF95_009140 [Exophiala dermatitidis]
MVGIARSRGCQTCRRRKIACGLEKPYCHQCIKSKRVCTGYQPYPIFIQHKVPSNTTTKLDVCAERGISASGADQNAGARQIVLPNSKYISSDHGGNVQLAMSLDLAGQVDPQPVIRQQLLEEYLSLHLPAHQLGPMQRRLWLFQLPTIPKMSPALEIATMALCMAKMSDVHNDSVLRHESLELYHRGLLQLQKALWDPEQMYDEQTLAACVALASYELSQCPNNSRHGYIIHTAGCEKLIRLRGPEAHKDGLAHQIFVQYRVQGILYALNQRQPTFLTEPVWQSVPYENNPKTVFDQVYDFITIATDMHKHGERIPFMDPISRYRTGRQMISECWRTDRALASLYHRLIKSHDGPLYWFEQAGRQTVEDEDNANSNMPLFPVAFHFPNLTIASTVLVFWACEAMLWQGMNQLYRLMGELRRECDKNDFFKSALMVLEAFSGFSADTDPFDLPALEHRVDFAAPARNIFQSVEYCLKEEMRDHGPKSVAAPLRIAMETLRAYPEYRRDVEWAEEAMIKVQQRSLRLLMYYTGTEEH